jgi:hypothetical protein
MSANGRIGAGPALIFLPHFTIKKAAPALLLLQRPDPSELEGLGTMLPSAKDGDSRPIHVKGFFHPLPAATVTSDLALLQKSRDHRRGTGGQVVLLRRAWNMRLISKFFDI